MKADHNIRVVLIWQKIKSHFSRDKNDKDTPMLKQTRATKFLLYTKKVKF